ncbi:MAG TPA: cytosolic protein [Acholeplasmataceae bacterium]|jgi:hypothetical protein|nr:cytosolic protein [Acholeplasmataceae bacterium]
MKFRDYFANDFETRDNHHIESLRSHYYRCRIENAMNAVLELAKKEKAVIKYIDEERYEIIFETSKYTVTATMVSPSFGETAVDFKILTFFMLPFGKGIKIIERLYKELDNLLPFKGIGLYR